LSFALLDHGFGHFVSHFRQPCEACFCLCCSVPWWLWWKCKQYCPSVRTMGSTGVGTTRSGLAWVFWPAPPWNPADRVRVLMAAVYATLYPRWLHPGSSYRVILGLPSCSAVRRDRVSKYFDYEETPTNVHVYTLGGDDVQCCRT